ncbi:MAG: hypothetical protein Q8P46_03355 [Hyphomicrobiales bacterium]|nr:hypothetical protein [Hyphomicrobiales bacterium]
MAVFEQTRATGPLFRIVFRNHEFVDRLLPEAGWLANAPANLIFAVLFVGFPFFLFAGIGVGDEIGIPWGISAAAILGAYAWGFMKFKSLRTLNRIIELEPGADRLRVLMGGTVSVERQLSRLASLTVEPHPEVEVHRMRRQERKQTRLTDAEKTHCLFGWFGVAGAEKVLLLSRAEWPNRDSLFEVRQAIEWAREQARGAAPQMKITGGDHGIKPPLD